MQGGVDPEPPLSSDVTVGDFLKSPKQEFHPPPFPLCAQQHLPLPPPCSPTHHCCCPQLSRGRLQSCSCCAPAGHHREPGLAGDSGSGQVSSPCPTPQALLTNSRSRLREEEPVHCWARAAQVEHNRNGSGASPRRVGDEMCAAEHGEEGRGDEREKVRFLPNWRTSKWSPSAAPLGQSACPGDGGWGERWEWWLGV